MLDAASSGCCQDGPFGAQWDRQAGRFRPVRTLLDLSDGEDLGLVLFKKLAAAPEQLEELSRFGFAGWGRITAGLTQAIAVDNGKVSVEAGGLGVDMETEHEHREGR